MLGGRRIGRKQRTVDLRKVKSEALKAAPSLKKVPLPILDKHHPTVQQAVSDPPEQIPIVGRIGVASRLNDRAKIVQVRGLFSHGSFVESKKPRFL